MKNKRALAQLTVLELNPPETVTAGAEAGFDAVGLRLHPVRPDDTVYPMNGDTPMMRETLARMGDTGITILDLEVMRLVREKDPKDFLPFFETGQRLGASRVLTLIDERDDGLSTELLARAADLAAPFGLTLGLEFMPWIGVNNLAQATKIAKAAGRKNVGLLVDSLHLSRSGGSPKDLASVPADLISFAQICDAPAAIPPNLDAIADEAKFERLMPGEGGLPLREFLAGLPSGIPISVEAPLRGPKGKLSGKERAKLAFDTLARLMDG
ncbi:MAG: sugar phosphate isomerase/epimerase [Bradyrhizobium sp.]